VTDSGAPLPPGWIWTALGAVADIRLGKMLSPKAYAPDLIQLPYLRNENVRWGSIAFDDVKSMGFHADELDRYGIQPMDLLVCEGGQPGRCAVYKGESGRFMYQKALHRVRPIGGIRPELIQYCLEHYVSSGVGLPRTSETTIQHLPLEKMNALLMPLPPIDEQRRIVEAIEEQFTRLDAAVSGLKRVQATLKRYRSSVLKAACEGRLVPTEAELARAEGREYEPADRLLARILEERQARGGTKYKASQPTNITELWPPPEGWTWTTSRDMCVRIENGNTPAPDRMSSSGEIPFIKVYNLTQDGNLNHSYKSTFINRETHETTLKRSRIFPNDVLMNIVGPPLGKVSLVPSTYDEWNTNQAVVLFTSSDGLLPRFLTTLLLSTPIKRYLESTSKATAGQFNVSLTTCRTLSIPLPPLAEQQRIVAEVERRLSVVEKAEAVVAANLKRAARMRQAILKRAFEGKLVPQDPNDEPASVLLERIRAEREQTAGTLPKRRGRPPVVKAEAGSPERNGQLRLLDADQSVAAKQRVIRRNV
jgi:type I restriction enzyme, S subunit